jgi:hypothetical protein
MRDLGHGSNEVVLRVAAREGTSHRAAELPLLLQPIGVRNGPVLRLEVQNLDTIHTYGHQYTTRKTPVGPNYVRNKLKKVMVSPNRKKL